MKGLMELRKTKTKLNQKQVAEKLGIKRATYSSYENTNNEPNIETLKKIADLFGVTLDILLGRKDIDNAENQIDIASVPIKLDERLRFLRKQQGQTQEQFAQKLNINISTYKSYETNRSTPTLETLVKISKFFGVSLDYLCGITPECVLSCQTTERQRDVINVVSKLDDIDCTLVETYILGVINGRNFHEGITNKKKNKKE